MLWSLGYYIYTYVGDYEGSKWEVYEVLCSRWWENKVSAEQTKDLSEFLRGDTEKCSKFDDNWFYARWGENPSLNQSGCLEVSMVSK